MDQTTQFSRNLRRAMAAKAFSQSDLARDCWGEEETSDGYMAARGRDKINKYCAGKSLPDEETMRLLAAALDVPLEALLEPPPKRQVTITTNAKRPDEVHVAVDAWTTAEIAMKIAALLEPEKPTEGS